MKNDIDNLIKCESLKERRYCNEYLYKIYNRKSSIIKAENITGLEPIDPKLKHYKRKIIFKENEYYMDKETVIIPE